MSKKLMVVLLVMAILLMSTGTAGAQSGPSGKPNLSDPAVVKVLVDKLAASKDQNQAWMQLSPEEQSAVVEFLTPTRVVVHTVPSSKIIPMTASCGNALNVHTAVNSSGWTLWTYSQDIGWCWNGSVVTSVNYRSRYGNVYAAFWQWAGNLPGDWTTGGAGQSSYRSWTQGQFQLCVPVLGCTTYAYPWLDTTVFGNGGVIKNHGQ